MNKKLIIKPIKKNCKKADLIALLILSENKREKYCRQS